MATGKRFYWIKLKDKFMTSDKVDFLMSQKNGANYVVLYQMLCLRTINTNGEFFRTIGEVIIPFDESKIQRDCKYFSIDTIRVALELYKQLGMVYRNENNILQIADFENMVGSETDYARQKRLQRDKPKLIENGQQVDKPVDIVHIDNRDKRIDNRDKDIKTNNKKIYSDFELLWKLYPNKQGKSKAFKSFEKAIKRGVPFEQIKAGIDSYLWYIKKQKIEPNYIKHGSTWFNQECWNDDYTITNQKRSTFQMLQDMEGRLDE